MFNQLLVLLEQPAPAPPVVVPRVTEGGGAEIRRWPRQQPLLQFEFRKGFLVTGTIQQPALRKPELHPTISYPLRILIPVRGQLQARIQSKYMVKGRLSEPVHVKIPIHGKLTHPFRIRLHAHGELTENPEDLEREIADLKYLIARKRRKRGEVE